MFSQYRFQWTGVSSLSPKTSLNIPTGISSLDAILGNGFSPGSIILVEEDEYSIYSEMFAKCYLAEGLTSSDYVFLACAKEDPHAFLRDLPGTVSADDDSSTTSVEKLKIAWRYQNNPQISSALACNKMLSMSHEFNLGSKIPEETINQSNISVWQKKLSENSLVDLYGQITQFINSKKEFIMVNAVNGRKLIRLLIKNIGSPFWSEDIFSLCKFLFQIRTIVHSTNSVAVITVPVKLLNSQVVNKLKHLSDVVISFTSFLNQPELLLNEFNGILQLKKISPTNSISIRTPEDCVWGLKYKKKKLIIVKLNLPPETTLTDQSDLVAVASPSCQLNF